MNKLVIGCCSALISLTATAANASPSAVREHVEGYLETGCRAVGVVKLCGDQDQALLVGGKQTDLIYGPWGELRPIELERRGNTYRVKMGLPGVADTDFFYFEEVSFEKVRARYLLTKITYASSQECPDRPDMKRIDTLDFRRGTLTTVVEPAWTASGKRWQYVHKVKTPTVDVRAIAQDRVIELMAETPANKRLCEIYG